MVIALNSRFTRFIIVGCSNAVISYVVFALLYYSGVFPPAMRTPLSQLISYSAAIAWSYFWSSRWAFRTDNDRPDRLAPQSVRFAVVQVACLFLGTALVTLLVDHVGFLPSLGWLIAMTAITAINFLAMHYWVFPTRAQR